MATCCSASPEAGGVATGMAAPGWAGAGRRAGGLGAGDCSSAKSGGTGVVVGPGTRGGGSPGWAQTRTAAAERPASATRPADAAGPGTLCLAGGTVCAAPAPGTVCFEGPAWVGLRGAATGFGAVGRGGAALCVAGRDALSLGASATAALMGGVLAGAGLAPARFAGADFGAPLVAAPGAAVLTEGFATAAPLTRAVPARGVPAAPRVAEEAARPAGAAASLTFAFRTAAACAADFFGGSGDALRRAAATCFGFAVGRFRFVVCLAAVAREPDPLALAGAFIPDHSPAASRVPAVAGPGFIRTTDTGTFH